MDDTYVEALAAGATLVTGNNRLARRLLRAFDAARQAAGHQVWPSADILPWNAWLIRSYERSASTRAVLNPHQEVALWERVVREWAAGGNGERELLQPKVAAARASEAWALARAWRVPLSAGAFQVSDEAQTFFGWAQRFQVLVAEGKWQDPAGLADILSADTPSPHRILLAGFDEMTPQQTALCEALREAGCSVERIAARPEYASPGAVRVGLRDAEAEVDAAARWARRILEQQGGAPEIGVVAPDLEARRDMVERIFADVLEPAAVLPGAPSTAAFHISVGRPLSKAPLVHAAVLALQCGRKRAAPLLEVGMLLRSPFLSGARQEAGARAMLDAGLRDYGCVEVALSMVSARAPSMLQSQLARFAKLRERLPAAAMPSFWSENFAELLKAIGWPGDRPLDSGEYQALDAWKDLLAEFASLDAVLPDMRYGEALARLGGMAAGKMFQPEEQDAPVQILGVLEAAGMHFDHLWVMGLHDEAWPQPAKPHPLLPVALQRRHGLPHSSADRELLFTRQLTARLMASAPDVVVSHPMGADDAVLRPSPLILHIPPGELNLSGVPAYAKALYGSAEMERLADEQAPPLGYQEAVRGGAALFGDQAACPFRAFARRRLGAEGLPSPRPGLPARERGTLLHKAMERVWAELESHANLLAASTERLTGLVQCAVADSVEELAGRLPGPRFAALEQWRLERLIHVWLEVEKTRPPFDVLQQERERRVEFAGLPLTLRIDRLDRLADGQYAVIDYKTGAKGIDAWFGERPDEPQLPLYACCSEEPVSVLLFAQIKWGEAQYKGLAADEGAVPGVATLNAPNLENPAKDWPGQIARWRAVLARLAEDFRAGNAAVDPKRGGDTCQHCDLQPLCRIHERS